jgi:hypothetical protein
MKLTRNKNRKGQKKSYCQSSITKQRKEEKREIDEREVNDNREAE